MSITTRRSKLDRLEALVATRSARRAQEAAVDARLHAALTSPERLNALCAAALDLAQTPSFASQVTGAFDIAVEDPGRRTLQGSVWPAMLSLVRQRRPDLLPMIEARLTTGRQHHQVAGQPVRDAMDGVEEAATARGHHVRTIREKAGWY